MCFPVRSIKCLDCRFSVWLFLQLCGRAWCVFPGAGLGESSSTLRQKQVVFMGNVKQKYGTWTLISAEANSGNWMMVTQVCERILFQNLTSLYWKFVLPVQTKIKLSSFLFFLNWRKLKPVLVTWNLFLFKLLLKSMVIAQARNPTFGRWILKTCCF